MIDLISRQAAIALRFTKAINEDGIIYVPLGEYLSGIKSLPSAQPDNYAKGYNDAKREIALSGEYERAYQRGKEDAQKWIPCSERLPMTKDDYIITVKDKSLTWTDYVEWSADYHWWGYDDDMVIAWMPLPEPYKGE